MKQQQTDYQTRLKKYIQQDQHLQQKMKKNQQIYRQITQIAIYSDLENVQSAKIFVKSSKDPNNTCFTYFSERYDDKMKSSLQYYVFKLLDEQLPKIKKQFSLIYIHHSFYDFLNFKTLLNQMPQHFYIKLKAIFIVSGGFLIKILNLISVGSFNKFLDKFFIYVQDLDELQNHNHIHIKDQRFNSGLKNMSQHNKNQTLHNNKPISKPGEVKIIRNQLYGKPLIKYELGRHGIAFQIQILLHRFLQNPQFAKAQGITRKSCDVQQLQILQNHLINKKFNYLSQVKDPYVIIGCLKKIFNNLETPLFSYQIYDEVIKLRAEDKQKQLNQMRRLIEMMDQLHRKTFLLMIAFFLKHISFNEQYNKMSPYNISVVFGPCFFRPKQYRIEDLMNSGKCSKVVLNFINHFEELIGHQYSIQYFLLLQKISA